jgi:hypothetical protein
MKIEDIFSALKNLEENDIVDMGEDYEGNPVFSVRIGNRVSTLLVGNQCASDYPEFYDQEVC